jgi:hypothetical protein
MRHLEVNHPPDDEPQTPTRKGADDGHHQLKPRSKLYDGDNLELARREVASLTRTAESYEKDTISSPLSANSVHSATSNLTGIGSGTQVASKSLSQSLFRFSLSSDGDPGSDAFPDHSPTFNNDWIKDFERQAAALDGINFQRAPACERRGLSEVPRQLISVSKQDPLTLKRPFVRSSMRQQRVQWLMDNW